MPQGPLPDCNPTRWAVLDGGWEDTGGPLIHFKFGRDTPGQVFGAEWGLDWLFPPGGWTIDQLLMHDLRWEHLVASALTPMGRGRLDRYAPTVAVPNWAQMVDRLIGAGFSKCYLTGGAESHLGAWAMDCVWNALQVWHGEVKATAKGGWVGNALYVAAALQMAADCGVQLSQWTRDIGGTTKPVVVGNVIEAYATLLVRERAWDEFCSVMFYLARHDSGGLSRFVAHRPQAGVSGQGAPPPPPDATAVGDVDGGVAGSPSGVATTHGAATGAALQTGAGASPAAGAWRPALAAGGSGAAGPQGVAALAPGTAGGGGAAPGTPDKTYVMGSFVSCEKDPDAWRRWTCWHGDLRPFRFVATGVHPEILEASTDDVAELRADLGDARLSAANFDGRHRVRLARVWIAEAPSQADFVLAQLGVGTWANDTVAPCGWGNLRRGRFRRFRNPWTPAELEAALDRNGPQRPANAPTGMLAQFREVVRTPPAGMPGPVTPPAFPAGGSGGTSQAGAAGATTPEGRGGRHGPTPSGPVGAPPRIGVAPCRHESPLGIDALASCANCQAYTLAAIAAGAEPPCHLPGVLRCGHKMESMDLCCQMCAEHVVSIEVAMGGEDPVREIVGGGIGGPLRLDPAMYLRVDPGSYLRIAADELVRRLTSGGRSALSLTEAIQAAQMLDMFVPRDKVMGLVDGDLSWFRRSWTYHAGHLDKPDPFWRYQPLMAVASALGVAPVSDMRLATGASPALAPADDRGWGEHSRGCYGEYARHGYADWRGGGSW